MRQPQTELERTIEEAFDYRGDVTVSLKSGETLVGFLFNRDFAPHAKVGNAPFVELALPSGENRRLNLSSIEGVELTGKDHAAPSA